MKMVHNIALPDSEQHFVGTLSRLHDEGKSFEYPALSKALHLLPQSRRRVAVDIGAHVGLWSIWLVKHFNFVHAFEPVDEYAEVFARNVAGNRQLHRVALGEAYGAVAMREYPANTGQAHVDQGVDGDITMLALDSYGMKCIDLVKIDVEGYELQVVKGAERTLLENRPLLVIEQRGCEEVNFGRKRDEALEWLLELGMVELDREHYDYILGWR